MFQPVQTSGFGITTNQATSLSQDQANQANSPLQADTFINNFFGSVHSVRNMHDAIAADFHRQIQENVMNIKSVLNDDTSFGDDATTTDLVEYMRRNDQEIKSLAENNITGIRSLSDITSDYIFREDNIDAEVQRALNDSNFATRNLGKLSGLLADWGTDEGAWVIGAITLLGDSNPIGLLHKALTAGIKMKAIKSFFGNAVFDGILGVTIEQIDDFLDGGRRRENDDGFRLAVQRDDFSRGAGAEHGHDYVSSFLQNAAFGTVLRYGWQGVAKSIGHFADGKAEKNWKKTGEEERTGAGKNAVIDGGNYEGVSEQDSAELDEILETARNQAEQPTPPTEERPEFQQQPEQPEAVQPEPGEQPIQDEGTEGDATTEDIMDTVGNIEAQTKTKEREHLEQSARDNELGSTSVELPQDVENLPDKGIEVVATETQTDATGNTTERTDLETPETITNEHTSTDILARNDSSSTEGEAIYEAYNTGDSWNPFIVLKRGQWLAVGKSFLRLLRPGGREAVRYEVPSGVSNGFVNAGALIDTLLSHLPIHRDTSGKLRPLRGIPIDQSSQNVFMNEFNKMRVEGDRGALARSARLQVMLTRAARAASRGDHFIIDHETFSYLRTNDMLAGLQPDIREGLRENTLGIEQRRNNQAIDSGHDPFELNQVSRVYLFQREGDNFRLNILHDTFLEHPSREASLERDLNESYRRKEREAVQAENPGVTQDDVAARDSVHQIVQNDIEEAGVLAEASRGLSALFSRSGLTPDMLSEALAAVTRKVSMLPGYSVYSGTDYIRRTFIDLAKFISRIPNAEDKSSIVSKALKDLAGIENGEVVIDRGLIDTMLDALDSNGVIPPELLTKPLLVPRTEIDVTNSQPRAEIPTGDENFQNDVTTGVSDNPVSKAETDADIARKTAEPTEGVQPDAVQPEGVQPQQGEPITSEQAEEQVLQENVNDLENLSPDVPSAPQRLTLRDSRRDLARTRQGDAEAGFDVDRIFDEIRERNTAMRRGAGRLAFVREQLEEIQRILRSAILNGRPQGEIASYRTFERAFRESAIRAREEAALRRQRRSSEIGDDPVITPSRDEIRRIRDRFQDTPSRPSGAQADVNVDPNAQVNKDPTSSVTHDRASNESQPKIMDMPETPSRDERTETDLRRNEEKKRAKNEALAEGEDPTRAGMDERSSNPPSESEKPATEGSTAQREADAIANKIPEYEGELSAIGSEVAKEAIRNNPATDFLESEFKDVLTDVTEGTTNDLSALEALARRCITDEGYDS